MHNVALVTWEQRNSLDIPRNRKNRSCDFFSLFSIDKHLKSREEILFKAAVCAANGCLK